MARKRSPGRPRRKPRKTDRLWRWEVVGVVAIVVGVFAFLSLPPFGGGGPIGDRWALLLRLAFGRGAYLASGGLVGGGFLLFLRPREWWGEQKERLWGVAILFLAFLGLIHLLPPALDPLALAGEGGGGGYLGWAISRAFAAALGRLGSGLALLIVGGVGLFLVAQVKAEEMRRGVQIVAQTLSSIFRREMAPRPKKKIEVPPKKSPSATPRIARPAFGILRMLQHPKEAKPEAIQAKLWAEKAPPPRSKDRRLPPLDRLNETPYRGASKEDVERKAHIIEETLASFGVPAKVVSIRPGPTVTQFGVEPGYIDGRREGERQRKVRVSKITSLDKDLALALASAPIRIEAPVPGRSVVGVEVPNSEVSLVALRRVMESEAFQKAKESSPLTIALGQDVSNQSVIGDLALMPHLLIAGATGSGKSVCLSSILTCLLLQNSPARLELVLIDPKMVELIHFADLPHLAVRVAGKVEDTLGVLRWVIGKMEERYKKFADRGARNIDHYNSLLASDESPLPYMVLAIDELADLMMMAPDEVERRICRLAQLSRATGIHLIIATQRPSVDVVTGLIKANFPARICFAVSSQVDSRVVLDTAGAETLLGRGDMLYMAPDSSSLVRLQGCFVSDEEIARVVKFWKDEIGTLVEKERVPWERIRETVAEAEAKGHDALFEKAKALVMQHKRASASFLQRRLGIGYPRAARLIEQLEEAGIVGPMESGGRSRKVLVREESPKDI